jgi:hypothetical protein
MLTTVPQFICTPARPKFAITFIAIPNAPMGIAAPTNLVPRMPALADLATIHVATHLRTVELRGYFMAMPRSIFMWAAVDPFTLP